MSKFPKDYQDIIKDELIVGSLKNELRNSWSIYISENELPTEEVFCAFISLVIENRTEQLPMDTAMWFYCWVDEMAGQFRFGIVSQTYDLPFGCKLNFVQDLKNIVNRYLTLEHAPGVPFAELQETAFSKSDTTSDYSLDVWQYSLCSQ